MTITVASDIWGELKRFISGAERDEAAFSLVNVLIDNDYDAEEIKQAFKGDSDIKRALQSHLDDMSDIDESDDEEDFDEYLDD
jgi:hypothetical protein